MHSLNVLVRAKRSLPKLGAFPHRRSFSAQPHYASSDDVQDQVLVDGRANSRTAILNRSSALNSLTTSMVRFFLCVQLDIIPHQPQSE
ncbi:hypothetical protein ACJRO7_034269 [Eucalyptus globulus]|uniref:Uncharacterized protein n=1 Tax=Eucalyptus globulus TaxID=34317 RepID=A0ABD3J6Z1_EUCGL